MFDWLLCREPVAAIWLAAAVRSVYLSSFPYLRLALNPLSIGGYIPQVILSRKEDVLALDRQGEEAMGMVHAVLSALPPLSEIDLSSSE